VVFEMRENSAPGPDGFSVSFYKSSWDTVKAGGVDEYGE
jgi:hypothetical protein